ncbi:hypothetical protein [Alicyclobacillus sp.]|uniref:hypothetical protein n=1 Tax=Alicyclobacillus sp. TaxID=61169 RepID=UPI0025BE2F8E|nr:hypothetical protein [Alicyclobacillus sp.]MCL6516810.1 hypothetical protein [Alicyclobacillus sp.]
MVTRAHAMRFVGQHIIFRTRDGALHHGILQAVNDEGIFVRPVGGATTRLANGSKDRDVRLLGTASAAEMGTTGPEAPSDVTQAWWPFFFFPFFALWWLAAWAWWW